MANYEHYKIFCKIVECKSISKAAEKLYVSQPAVSFAVKQLETSLNTKLFFRTRRGVNLTAEGKILYEHVKQGCEIIYMGEKKLQDFKKPEMGEINIGIADIGLYFYLVPFIEKLRSTSFLFEINLSSAQMPEILKNIKEDLLDFGMVFEPFDEEYMHNSDFKFTPLNSFWDTFEDFASDKPHIKEDLQKINFSPELKALQAYIITAAAPPLSPAAEKFLEFMSR